MSAPADTATKIPPHVPAELVWEGSYDAFTAEGDDPFLAVSRFHELPPVIWVTDVTFGRPGWVCTRFDSVSEGFIDHARFSAERPGMIGELVGEPVRLNPIEIDPPAHHGYRKNLNPVFTPKAVGAMGDAVKATCESLIASFADKGRCDFVRDFAIPFPTYVFLDLMGMPRDLAQQFLDWEDELMRAPDMMDRVKAARGVYHYLKAHKDSQLANPVNELNRAIVTGTFDGRPLDHLEMMGMYYVLYVGGLDTVYSTLGWIMRHLATHPEDQTALRVNPELIPAAIEEFCRAFSVVNTHRHVAVDCEFHGAPLRKGDELHLPIALANRDPAVFADPHRIDFTRKPRHITFGTGTHSCLGIHLAKRELRTVVEAFLAHFRNIRPDPDQRDSYHTGRTFGMDSLPLLFDRA
ncbi:MAG TPA: cytochrome P450 [Novosphingobium sp.]|nr:cytochrome P450 [Novosphingobium sp.]